ncbi:MAG: flagellar biosynthesis protein FlhB [bacterium]
MPEQSAQERTEKATARRREKAREEGQVARSTEINAAGVICLGFATVYLMGPHIGSQIKQLLRYTMANAPTIAVSDPTFIKIFGDNMLRFFTILVPLFAVMMAVAFAVNIVQVGFKVTPKAMEPKLEKLNLAKGIKRILSVKSLVTLIRDSLKLIIVGLVAYLAIKSDFESFFLLPDQTITQLAIAMSQLALLLALKIGLVIMVLAILDYVYQKYEFEKSIRMSKQELKDEYKDTDGSPQLKARVRQIQREMSRSRMMKAVPTADVVVTNPTEIAVALKYQPEKSTAPFVVAKGQRLLAQKIRDIATENDIPIVENKPLARSLFEMCEIGQIIPADLYRAVAEVLAYVYRLKGKVLS